MSFFFFVDDNILFSKYIFDSIRRNLAPVSGGERELRTMFLKPFNRACLESLSMMTAYSSYDGIPAIANSRTYNHSQLTIPKFHCFNFIQSDFNRLVN